MSEDKMACALRRERVWWCSLKDVSIRSTLKVFRLSLHGAVKIVTVKLLNYREVKHWVSVC